MQSKYESIVELYEKDKLKRKQTEQALRSSEIKFRALFEQAGGYCMILDPNTENGIPIIIDANIAACKEHGYTRDEFIGRNVVDIDNEDGKKLVKERTALIMTGKPFYVENIHVRKDGSSFPVAVNAKRIDIENEPSLIFTTEYDISQRQGTAKKLKESELLFRKMIEHMPDGVAIYRPIENSNDFIFLEINKHAEIITNTTNKELIGCTLLQKFPNMINSPLLKALKKVNETGKDLYLPPFYYKDNEREGWRENNIYKLPSGEIVAIFTDVTEVYEITEKLKDKNFELEKAKEKAEISEKYYHTILNNMGDPVFVKDEQSRFLLVNDAFCSTLGLTRDEIINKTLAENLPSDEMDHFFKIDKVVLTNGLENSCEEPLTVKGGRTLTVSTRKNRFIDNDGNKFLIGVIHDITEQKKAEEILKERTRFFDEMFDITALSTWVSDENGIAIRINPACYKFFGAKEEEVIGKYNVFKDEVIEKQGKMALVKMAFATGKPVSFLLDYDFGKVDHVNVTNATHKYIKVNLTPIVDEEGKVTNVVSQSIDLTDIKEVEKELIIAKEKAEANEANITAIIEGTTNSIWAFNRNYEILYINQVLQQEFLQSFGILLEPGMKLVESLPKSQQPIWRQRYDKVLANEQFTVEDAIPTNNGTIFIQVSFNPIVKNGEVIGGSCLSNNITLRKLAEIELTEAKEKAEESDRLKSAFLANMSHEIRTPMNGILGFSDLLKNPALSGKQQQKYIGIIEKSGARMLSIINDIISISKIESGLMEVNKKELNINEHIEYIYSFFKPEVEGKNMQLLFRNQLPSKEAIVNSDSEKVYAVLTNIVKNAIKYSDKGSIEIGYNKKGNYLEFYVKDTGIGIPKNRKKAIFERFIQADISDKEAYQGAGLGLSISKAYVEMLNGKIWVESEEGKGSAFYFTLPYNTKLEEGNTSINEILDAQNITSIKKLKMLIVEDDETSAELISIIVQEIGKVIINARTGIESVEACKKNPDIDLILMDIQIPEMNGYEATREIRKFNKDVIIIAQTAYALEGDKEKAVSAGCNDYISKPINKEILFELISKHL